MLPLPSSWSSYLKEELKKPYISDIMDFLESETKAGKTIYPEVGDIFNALKYTDFEEVKVVILGQDPYHGEGQAHGLSFSVRDSVKIPPSLRNIFKELENEGFSEYEEGGRKKNISGNLESWAKQGVLLLNSVLTVEQSKPGSHAKIGWQSFTDTIIKTISREKSGVVFLLWGAYAISKQELIDSEKHLILTSPHPSPFSAYTGFFGNDHFILSNDYLNTQGKKVINWEV